MTQERALTWSKKWHIVNQAAKIRPGGNYLLGLCGATLYRDEELPSHLKLVRDGKVKNTGLCKICAKAEKVTTLTVELPDENVTPAIFGNHEWPTVAIDPGAKVVVRASDGKIANDGIGSPYRSSAHARSHAAALLAAAEWLDRNQGRTS